ncbi:MAG: hypothetical protein AAGC60_05585 [Acidobacteriota bacterium]
MTEPAAFLERLKGLGVHLSCRGDRLRIDAPKGTLDEALREKIKQLKQSLLLEVTKEPLASEARSDRIASVASMNLCDFAQAGLVVRVWSDLLQSEVLFVSDNVDEERIRTSELPVYRAHELEKLHSFGSPRGIQAVHHIKKIFGGEVSRIDEESDDE